MSGVSYTLLADGSSDRALMHAIDWVLRHCGQRIERRVLADLRSLRPKPVSLAERIGEAARLFPCDVLFVHRDAEAKDARPRHDELEAAVTEAALKQPWVAVIPIRMTEAWLLHDESAIRQASGNPSGTVALNLPSPAKVESVTDPKDVLSTALLYAADLNRRRRQQAKAKFGVRRQRVAELIEDYRPLLAAPAFAEFVGDVERFLAERT